MSSLEPLRPSQDSTRPPNAEDALALAERIASSPARFVYVLERHNWTFLEDVFKEPGQEKIADGGIYHYAYEYPVDVPDVTLELHSTDSAYIEDFTSYTQDSSFVDLQDENFGPLEIHAIGYALLTFEEVMDDLSRAWSQSGKDSIPIIREYFIVPLQQGRHAGQPPAFSLYEMMIFILEIASRQDDEAEAIISYLLPELQEAFRAKLDEGGEEDLFWKQFNQEQKLVWDRVDHFRLNGKCDSKSSERLLALIGPEDSAVIKYGAHHGLYDIETTLPSCVQRQAKMRGQRYTEEILMVVMPQEEEADYASILEDIAEGKKLRTGIRVWNYMSRSETSLEAWMGQMAAKAAQKAKITAPEAKP